VSIGSLIGSTLVGTALVGASIVAGPASVAQADPPPADPPTSIVLTSDESAFAAGSLATLTATTDSDIAGTSSTVTITDETTNSTLATCTAGLACTVGTSFLTGGPHTYVATVNGLTSNELSVGREAWAVTLTSNKTVFATGENVTLTSTTNQDVGNTGGSYTTRIYDLTTGAVIVACTTGTICTANTSFYSGDPHTYVAEVAYIGSASWPKNYASDVQADSGEISAARVAWTVSLTSNKTVFAAGDSVTLTAVTNQDVGNTNGSYTTRIYDMTTGAVIASCSTGTTCSGTTTFYSGDAHSYQAEVAYIAAPWYPKAYATDIQADSNTVTAAREAWTVSLSADKTVFTAGDYVTLTAVMNQDVGNTNGSYRTRIYDLTTGAVVAECSSGSTCVGSTTFYSGDAHSYQAEVAYIGASWWQKSYATDIQADSGEVAASRDTWSVTLSSNKTVFAAGDSVTLTSTTNQDVGNTNGSYRTRIYDLTTGTVVAECSSGTTCSGTSSFYTGDAHTYLAEVAYIGASWWQKSYATDIQADSDPVSAAREAWTVTLSTNKTVFAAGDSVTLTSTTNQDVGNTNGSYRTRIYDLTTGAVVAECSSGATCSGTSSFYTGAPHTYQAEVAYIGASWWQKSYATDVQADSNTVTAAREAWTVTLSSDKTVFAAGQDVTLTAHANQDVGNTGTNYAIRIYDTTSGDLVAVCSTGTTCTGTSRFYSGGAHTYVAEVSSAWSPSSLQADTYDVQATSNTVSATREAWTVTMTTTSHSYVSGGTAYLDTHLHAAANQNVGDTGGTFYIVFWDHTTGTFIDQCNTGETCAFTMTALVGARPDSFMAYVMPSDTSLAAPANWEAASNGYSRPTGVGAVLPGESSGGANPAENNSCGCAHGDPVNTETGEFDLSVTDDGIPGAGPAVAVERSYSSSAAATSGPFGYGWSANFGAQLSVLIGGNTADPLPRQVQIAQENGSTVVFTENGDQTYSAPARVMATLSWDSTAQQWVYTRQLREVLRFDSTGTLIGSQDLDGNSVTYGYTAGQVTAISGSGGRSLSLTWTGGHVTGITDSAGRTASYSYDASGNLTSVTGVDSSVSSFGYDSNHLMTTAVKPNGGTTTNVYDSSNRVVSQTDPAGRVTTFNYIGSTTYTVDPDSGVTVEIYDSGLMTSQTRAAGTSYAQTTAYTYDDNNDVASVTDQLGNVTSYTNDANGDVLTETDPLSRTTTWTYDALGDILTVLDPLSRESSATYDAAGNKLSATSPGGHTEHWTYNANGTIASAEDALGNTTTYGHNSAGDLTSSTDPDGHTNSQTFNTAGSVTSSTDGGGNVTTVTSDAAGRTLSVTDPNAHTTTFEYDGDGNRTSAESAAGHVTTYTYDLADELTATTVPGDHTTSYAYTGTGLLATTTDPNSHATSTVYNSLGLPTSVTNGNGKTTHFGYDGDGRQTSVTMPSGGESTSTYDNAGQKLTSLTRRVRRPPTHMTTTEN
jgi:YD repeat-containing protein